MISTIADLSKCGINKDSSTH